MWFNDFRFQKLSKFITYLSESGDVLGDIGLTHLFPLKIRDVEVPSLLDDSFSEIVVSPLNFRFLHFRQIICKQLLFVHFDIV